MKKIIPFLCFTILVCSCSSKIDSVKNGVLQGHEETTVGNAVESVFGEVEWNYFETDKGVEVVEAKGLPGKQLLIGTARTYNFASYDDQKIVAKYCESPKKFVMQFILYKNSNGFEISYCGSEDGKSVKCEPIIDYMYQSKAKYESMVEICEQYFADKAEKEAEKARKEEEKRLAEEKRQLLMKEAQSSIKNLRDPRDEAVYRTVKIGEQRWMAENLNFKTPNSYCYEQKEENCLNYGRLYIWNEAKNVCPPNWHLPSDNEFRTLQRTTEPSSLRARSGWDTDPTWGNQNGEDDFYFSELPAGSLYYKGDYYFKGLGKYSYFWTSTENGSEGAVGYEKMHPGNFYKVHYFSVRCVMDDNPQIEEQLEPYVEIDD